jgi:hypothetical protein
MKLSDELQKKLQKLYEPCSLIQLKFRGNDVAFKTDEKGNAILLFIGKANAEGKIKGYRYARTLKFDAGGNVIKDHWDLKGKAS